MILSREAAAALSAHPIPAAASRLKGATSKLALRAGVEVAAFSAI
jgi:hypothetical protein